MTLREEKVKAEKKLAPTSRLQDIPAAHNKLFSHLPPTEVEAAPALEPEHEMEVTNPEPNVCCFSRAQQCITHLTNIYYHS